MRPCYLPKNKVVQVYFGFKKTEKKIYFYDAEKREKNDERFYSVHPEAASLADKFDNKEPSFCG